MLLCPLIYLTSCSTSPTVPVVQTKVVTVTVANPVPVPAELTTPKEQPPPNLQPGATVYDLVNQNLLWQQAYAGLVAQLEEIATWSEQAVARLRQATTTTAPPQTSGKPKQ